jgi:hypothetical protein
MGDQTGLAGILKLRGRENYSNWVIPTLIEKNTTILQNRCKILQKRNKYSAYNNIVKLW